MYAVLATYIYLFNSNRKTILISREAEGLLSELHKPSETFLRDLARVRVWVPKRVYHFFVFSAKITARVYKKKRDQ
jgi:hypothetical protein